jgi:hypothetical protein
MYLKCAAKSQLDRVHDHCESVVDVDFVATMAQITCARLKMEWTNGKVR